LHFTAPLSLHDALPISHRHAEAREAPHHMIVGIGVDLAEVHRIRDALERPSTGERFRARVFTAGEQAYCERRRRKYESYAARFAAKESVMKALGRGWSREVGWTDIEVVRERGGRPTIRLHGRPAADA